jgi:glycosyltransferase involved in cell wall biosynthesis
LLGVHYAIVLQAAGANSWISPKNLPEFRAAYAHAEQCYFVSAENRDFMEANLALDLSSAEIVDQPFTVRHDATPPWLPPAECWKLACVARIHFPSKGQDLLLQALRSQKWRERPLHVSLWGTDQGSLAHVRRLIDLHGLHKHVSYSGVHSDIEALWGEHHAMVLPSRTEGSSLALNEAMLCGRVPIATQVGRAGELIDDNQSGFIAPAATVELIDNALERAWQRRHEWQAIGARAAQTIRERHSLRPAEDFADKLLRLASADQTRRRLAA